MPADLLAWGRQVLGQQPFSAMLNAQLDAFAPGGAELLVPGRVNYFKGVICFNYFSGVL